MDLSQLVERSVDVLFEEILSASNERPAHLPPGASTAAGQPSSGADSAPQRTGPGIPPEIAQVDSEVAAYTLILRSVQSRISVRRAYRNTFASINGLPQDLMLVIFDLVTDSWKQSTGYYSQLCGLRLVCKAWDAFIRDHSSFWAPVFPILPEQLQDVTITRSRNHPLDVRYPGRGRRGRGGSSMGAHRSRCDRFMSKAIAEHFPVKSLAYAEYRSEDFGPPEPSVYTFLASPAPSLQRLKLTVNRPLDNLFAGVAPALRHVALDNSELGPDIQVLANLRSLELRQVRGLSLPQLLRLLSQSPDIELVYVEPEGFAPGDLGADVRVTLSRLRLLQLTFISSAQATSIIGAISIPSTTNVLIHVSRDFSLEDDFGNLVKTVAERCEARAIHVRFHHVQFLIIAAGSWRIKTDLYAGWDGNPAETIDSEYFLRMIPSPARELVASFDFIAYHRSDDILSAMGAAFPSCQEVLIELQTYGEDFTLNPLKEAGELRQLTLVQGSMYTPPLEAVVQLAEARQLTGFKWMAGGTLSAERGATEILERIRSIVPQVEVEEREANEWDAWPYMEVKHPLHWPDDPSSVWD